MTNDDLDRAVAELRALDRKIEGYADELTLLRDGSVVVDSKWGEVRAHIRAALAAIADKETDDAGTEKA